MDSKEDDSREYKEDRPPESESSWFSPSSWFSARDKKSTTDTWQPGKYQSDFFNKFDPKKVFDKRTKESKELRKKIILNIMDGVYRIEERSPYFKDTKLVQSSRDDINLEYKGKSIATYSTKNDTITKKRGYQLKAFNDAINEFHNVDATQEFIPQVEDVLEPPNEEDFDFDDLIKDLDNAKYDPDNDEYVLPGKKDDVSSSPNNDKSSSFFSALKTAASITSTVVSTTGKIAFGAGKLAVTGTVTAAKGFDRMIGGPESDFVKDVHTTTEIKKNTEDLIFERLKMDYDTLLEDNYTLERDQNLFTEELTEKKKEYESLKKERDKLKKRNPDINLQKELAILIILISLEKIYKSYRVNLRKSQIGLKNLLKKEKSFYKRNLVELKSFKILSI